MSPVVSLRRSLPAVAGALVLFLMLLMPTPASAQDRPVLKLGSSGDAVLVLEERLVELGFPPGTVDTEFDGATRSAVIDFQRAASIAVDGIVGPQTWRTLDRGATAPDPDPDPGPTRPLLRLGSTGDAVLVLEQRLIELGYSPGTVDTRFDSATRSAVLAFQRAAGIDVDGLVGPVTWATLDEGVAAPDPDPTPDPGPAPAPDPDPAPTRPVLRLGSTGDAVEVLEERLVELGFSPGTVDTRFDSATRSAVLDFQRAAGIDVDGIVGPQTWGALDRGVPAPDPTPGPGPEPDPDDLLRLGDEGPRVLALEQRLTELGYWLPAPDRLFDSNTHHAVVALQKASGLTRDGVVGPSTRAALDAGTRPAARYGGDHLEVDLARQLLMVVRNGQVRTIYDTATGKVIGTTPSGTYSITREIDGYRYAPLGTLYRPKYFYGGVAIHGYPSVPPYPASHGCVRVTYPAMDHIWATGVAPVGSTIRLYRS